MTIEHEKSKSYFTINGSAEQGSKETCPISMKFNAYSFDAARLLIIRYVFCLFGRTI